MNPDDQLFQRQTPVPSEQQEQQQSHHVPQQQLGQSSRSHSSDERIDDSNRIQVVFSEPGQQRRRRRDPSGQRSGGDSSEEKLLSDIEGVDYDPKQQQQKQEIQQEVQKQQRPRKRRRRKQPKIRRGETAGSEEGISSLLSSELVPPFPELSQSVQSDDEEAKLADQSIEDDDDEDDDKDDDNIDDDVESDDDIDSKPPLVVCENYVVDIVDMYLQRTSRISQINYNDSKKSPEVDFYNNPTVLSRLILNEKYVAATRRIYEYPHETSVRVCAKRRVGLTSSSPRSAEAINPELNVVYTKRQLPIHVACQNLRRTHDSKMKKMLNALIANLIFANPKGSYEIDHNKRYPIQEAIWYGAAAATISLFLLANPSSVHIIDAKGRTLRDINRHSPCNYFVKDQLDRILGLGEKFWKEARKEAKFRLLHKNIKWPGGDSATIGSLSVLASSNIDEETIVTKTVGMGTLVPFISSAEEGKEEEYDDFSSTESVHDDYSDQAQPSRSSTERNAVIQQPGQAELHQTREMQFVEAEPAEVTPLSWNQLETRAIVAETTLMEMNEKYYELSKKVEALSLLGRQNYNELYGELSTFALENNNLNINLQRLESILTNIAETGEDEDEELKSLLDDMNTKVSLVDVVSLDASFNSDNLGMTKVKLQEQVVTLTQSQTQQRERIQTLAYAVGKILLKGESSAALASSMISNHETPTSSEQTAMSELTSRSAKSYELNNYGKKVDQRPIVDMTKFEWLRERHHHHHNQRGKKKAEQLDDGEGMEFSVDDLEDVFRLAATHDVQMSPRGKIVRRIVPDMMMDSPGVYFGNTVISVNDLCIPALIPENFEFKALNEISDAQQTCFQAEI